MADVQASPTPKVEEEMPFAIKRVQEVRKSAAEQKNRAKVLVYASAAESDLTELFAKVFVGSSGTKNDKLLDPKRPGALDFGTKIELSYRLGLISHRLKTHLDMIRDFRNDCAHLENDFNFSETDYRSRIKGAFLELGTSTQDAFKPPKSDDYENMFETICTLSILSLQATIEHRPKISEAVLEAMYIQ